jgi:CHAD domain-containing protein
MANQPVCRTIKVEVMVDLNSLQKPFRKLCKTLKGFRKNPAPDAVHRLRTQTRRAEAAVRTLALDQKRNGLRLLKILKPTRKAAGKVRDIDVFVGFASKLPTHSENQRLVELLESLGNLRARAAKDLYKVLARKQKEIRRRLSRCSKFIEKRLSSSIGGRPGSVHLPTNVAALSLQLESELDTWPKLNKKNLHPYRLKVKELRYTLQLDRESDSGLIQSLGEVQDQIGRWHDWDTLATITYQILDHGSPCEITAQITHQAQDHLIKALSAAKALGKQYFSSNATQKQNGRTQRRPVGGGLNNRNVGHPDGRGIADGSRVLSKASASRNALQKSSR